MKCFLHGGIVILGKPFPQSEVGISPHFYEAAYGDGKIPVY